MKFHFKCTNCRELRIAGKGCVQWQVDLVSKYIYARDQKQQGKDGVMVGCYMERNELHITYHVLFLFSRYPAVEQQKNSLAIFWGGDKGFFQE